MTPQPDDTMEVIALSEIAALRVKLERVKNLRNIYRELRRLTKQVEDKLGKKVK